MKSSNAHLPLAMAAVVSVIAYGSLFPFMFHAAHPGGAGPLMTLLGTWDKTPGRGDFLSNILLYLPLGFTGAIAPGARASLRRLAAIVAFGMALSFTVECLQYYDSYRDTEATDLYANTLGTALGAAAGWFFGKDFRLPFFRELSTNRVPTLLLLAWLGYRLYPYVPTINLHKYWDALKPVVLHPELTAMGLLRQTAIWLCIRALADAIAGPRGARFYWLFAGATFVASILILFTWINVAQIAGVVLAFLVWRLVGARRATVAAGLLGAYLVLFRLEPFQFDVTDEHFSWMPFLSFMRGSIDTDVQSFCEKFFLYGGLIWLMARAGVGLRLATGSVAMLLLATSAIEAIIPGRSAEVTDALLALAAGWAISLEKPTREPTAAPEIVTLTDQLVLVEEFVEAVPAYETAAE